MLIRILRDTSIVGQPVKVGDEVEVSDSDARYLLGVKKAEVVDRRSVVVLDEAAPVEARKPRTRKPQGA